MVILAASILSTADVLRALPVQRLKRNTLFVDVLSVKVGARRKRRLSPKPQAGPCAPPRLSAGPGSRRWGGWPGHTSSGVPVGARVARRLRQTPLPRVHSPTGVPQAAHAARAAP